LVPGMRSLFETIERLLKKTYGIRSIWINKTRWLLAIHYFIKMAMDKSIFDVQLMDGLGMRHNNTQN
jgi:hypothetical protein